MTTMQRCKIGLGLRLLTLSVALAAGELPVAPLRNLVPPLQLVGNGTLRWFGLPVYDVELFAEQPPYSPQGTALLSIRYRISIKHQRLVASTLEEWQRVGQGSSAQHERWRQQLEGLWPDVQDGDRLTAFRRANGPTQFYFGDRLLGEIADPAFGPAFFAIWLDKKCRYPKVRDELLGGQANLKRKGLNP